MMLQGFYEDIDNRGLTIKGWSISVAIAGMGAAFLYSGQLFLYVMLAALFFWGLEGYWRGLSFFFSSRILEIEAAMRGDDIQNFTPLQTYKTWDAKYTAKGDQTWRYMKKFVSMFPHLLIAGGNLILFILSVTGMIEPFM